MLLVLLPCFKRAGVEGGGSGVATSCLWRFRKGCSGKIETCLSKLPPCGGLAGSEGRVEALALTSKLTVREEGALLLLVRRADGRDAGEAASFEGMGSDKTDLHCAGCGSFTAEWPEASPPPVASKAVEGSCFQEDALKCLQSLRAWDVLPHTSPSGLRASQQWTLWSGHLFAHPRWSFHRLQMACPLHIVPVRTFF